MDVRYISPPPNRSMTGSLVFIAGLIGLAAGGLLGWMLSGPTPTTLEPRSVPAPITTPMPTQVIVVMMPTDTPRPPTATALPTATTGPPADICGPHSQPGDTCIKPLPTPTRTPTPLPCHLAEGGDPCIFGPTPTPDLSQPPR